MSQFERDGPAPPPGWVPLLPSVPTTRRSPVSHFHDLTMTSITGEAVPFSRFADRLCLIVNVASH